MEQLLEPLQQIQQFVLLYPPHEKGPTRVCAALSKQTLVQQSLAPTLGLNQLCSSPLRPHSLDSQ